jgi:hypothetical protein
MSALVSTRARRAAAFAVIAAFTAACEPESNPVGPGTGGELPINEIATTAPLNASSTDTLIYFSLASGTVVPRTGEWDIALRRFEVRLNGGVSGTRGVVGYSMKNNATATNAQVLAFTAENTLPAFDAVRAAQIPDASQFQTDRLFESNTSYINFSGNPTANATAYWKVKTATGGFALVRVTSVTFNQQFALTSITFESRAQSGSTLGAAQQITVPVSGTASVSFVTNQSVTPSGCNWDWQVNGQTLAITVNTACSVGTYPGPTSPTFAAATAANDAPEYAAFLAGLTGPIPNSITAADAPFRYNLENTNRLHPAFNTYLVKVGAKVYKLQLINYYNAAGASAWPTLRYARIL